MVRVERCGFIFEAAYPFVLRKLFLLVMRIKASGAAVTKEALEPLSCVPIQVAMHLAVLSFVHWHLYLCSSFSTDSGSFSRHIDLYVVLSRRPCGCSCFRSCFQTAQSGAPESWEKALQAGPFLGGHYFLLNHSEAFSSDDSWGPSF